MLYYDRINKNEGIDFAKSNKSKICMICRCSFFNRGFEFQNYVCNCCHDLALLSVSINDIVIITVKNVDIYIYIYIHISR